MHENKLLRRLREGEELSFFQQLLLIIQLSIPAIFANISQVLMEYIDASMVGSLGAESSAAIGLVSSSTWLGGGILMAAATGFTVQVAQYIGAGDDRKARELVHESLIVCLGWSLILLVTGTAISGSLPVWLGGNADIQADAAWYFRIFALSAPIVTIVYLAGGMIQASGNMVIPSALHILMCFLDVVFNCYWIFDDPTVQIGTLRLRLPGAGLGVAGAALGTVCAEAVAGAILLVYLLCGSPRLRKRAGEKHHIERKDLRNSFRIGVPVGIQQAIQSGAQVVSTTIVSPLGTVAIAANSLAVTAEGLCYMPGYGIGTAAQTLIGQSLGAGHKFESRTDAFNADGSKERHTGYKYLVRRLAWLTTVFGMIVQAGSGALMYLLAPAAMHMLSSDPAVQVLGAQVLRIEAFAEPFFAASIVASGALRGAGDTFVPSIMGLVSMWAVRLPIAAYLAPRIGLRGVWIAMAIELTFRGIIYLIRLAGRHWTSHAVTG